MSDFSGPVICELLMRIWTYLQRVTRDFMLEFLGLARVSKSLEDPVCKAAVGMVLEPIVL